MKKLLLIIFTSVYSVFCFGQTLESDSIQLDIKKTKLNKDQRLDQYPPINERNIFDSEIPVENKYNTKITDYDHTVVSPQININIPVPEFYERPVSDYLSNSRSPFADDYGYNATYRLSDRSWLSTRSSHNTLLTMGFITNIEARYDYKVTDKLTVSGGAYTAGYQIGYKHFSDMGINSSIGYNINDKITIHAYGQYSGFAKKNRFDSSGPNQGLFPQSYYGAAFEYKITEKFGVIGGMNRELNPMTGKWKNTPYVAPVFYSK